MKSPAMPVARQAGQAISKKPTNIIDGSIASTARRRPQDTRHRQPYRPRPAPLLDLELATKLFGPVEFVTGLPTAFIERGRR
jgi:hypothetical protein